MKIEVIKKVMTYIIAVCAVAAMVAIWPFGVIRYTSEVRGYPEEFQYSLNLVTNNTIQEFFTPQYDYLKGIVVYFTETSTDNTLGLIYINLLDKDGNLVAYDYVPMDKLTDGYYTFKLNSKVTQGEQYSYYIYSNSINDGENIDIAPKLVYRTLSTSGPTENGAFFMNGIPFEDCSAAGGYDYGLPLRLSQILCYDSFILLIALLLIGLLNKERI